MQKKEALCENKLNENKNKQKIVQFKREDSLRIIIYRIKIVFLLSLFIRQEQLLHEKFHSKQPLFDTKVGLKQCPSLKYIQNTNNIDTLVTIV